MWVNMSSSINLIFVNSKPFEIVVNHIKSDSILMNNYGKVIQIDSSVGGHFKQYKSARLVFDIETTKKELAVTAELTYDSGRWNLDMIEYD